MDQFWEEFETGEIHFRDKWQFELKSEFTPLTGHKQSEYTQEFFIFIPASLHINEDTYTKNDFFKARTNLIRLLSPECSFDKLLDPNYADSPFTKLRALKSDMLQKSTVLSMEMELKLFANIFRGNLKKEVFPIIHTLERAVSEKRIQRCVHRIDTLLLDVDRVQKEFASLEVSILKRPEGVVLMHVFEYIRDAMSITLNSLMTALLSAVRYKVHPLLKNCDIALSNLLLREKKYREDQLKEPDQLDKDAIENEGVLYQSGLINKFILDALQLKTERQATDEKFRSLIASFAAGIAMLLYLLLFIWQGAIFVFNSLPFVVFTVLIYIVKDRIKEELKSLSYRHVFKWFPDYTTQISLPTGKKVIGKVDESFCFIDETKVPLEISQLRNQEFHSYLEMIKRRERVISYKKKIGIAEHGPFPSQGLSVIFRLDIHNFLVKGSNAHEPYVTLDRETLELTHIFLPKVYHINIILKNRFLMPDLKEKIEFKKFRIVADKEGIKRIESITNNFEESYFVDTGSDGDI